MIATKLPINRWHRCNRTARVNYLSRQNGSLIMRALVTITLLSTVINAHALPLERLKLPAGLKIEVVAEVPNARQMALTAKGTLIVGSRGAGTVHALQDRDSDGFYEKKQLLADNLNMPSGLTVMDGDLYIAAVSQILKIQDIEQNLSQPVTELIYDQLPEETHHGWKYLTHRNGRLYFNIGAPCNICLREDKRFATIAALEPASGKLQLIANGVRNSVGLAWHPSDGSLWFTENGGDHLGDDRPDDELNRMTTVGQHYGYPHIHGDGLKDKQYRRDEISGYQAPEALLGAHVAPLGLTFYQGTQIPEADKETLFIALHGSWNRSSKVGYQILKVQTRSGKVTQQQVFVDGWLTGQRHWGRPADVITAPDGSLLISDDYAGVIYRVSKR